MSLVFTPGEPAGIGLDLAILYAQKKQRENLLTFADPQLLLERAKALDLPINIVESEALKNPGDICVYPVKSAGQSTPGKLDKKHSHYVLETIRLATEFCLTHDNHALVTGPIHKGVINEAGVRDFSGHTEYLQQLAKVDKTVMMLATEGLSVALATTHMPLSEVPKSITPELLTRTLEIIHTHFKKYGVDKPLISVCGLNPHAGEDGYLGREEIDVINPVINQLNTQGYHLRGSVPADTAFTPDALSGVDCVLSMYHDQGLPVLKTLGFKKAVNVTLGLPFVRTSVDHGTALPLAGQAGEKISLGSLQTAIDYANRYINNAKHA